MLLMDYTLGFNVTFTGVVIVFLMLVLLVMVLSIFGLFSQSATKKDKKKVAPVKDKTDGPKKEEKVAENNNLSDGRINPEIIAVISAAVASMYETSSKKPVIKSVKRSAATRPAWASAGIYNNTRAF